jgi:hypothetical protein
MPPEAQPIWSLSPQPQPEYCIISKKYSVGI